MSTITTKHKNYFYGTDEDGNLCTFSRDFRNINFVNATGFSTNNIYISKEYNAFPFFINHGNYLIGIFSSGISHGQSDKQIMVIQDKAGNTLEVFDFYTTTPLNLSKLNNYLSDGDVFNLKSFIIKKVNGITNVTVSAMVGGYAVWSKSKQFSDGLYRRTGYANGECAVFYSIDGVTWEVESIAFKQDGQNYTEADIVEPKNGEIYAVCRNTTDGYLYESSYINGTWSVPVSLFQGVQPQLINNDLNIMLGYCSRSGTTGFSNSGQILGNNNSTGVYLRIKESDAYGFPTRIYPIWSTDGGQPSFVNTDNGISVFLYSRRSKQEDPDIFKVNLKEAWLL